MIGAFEDSERTVEELKDFFFFLRQYHWTTVVDLNLSSVCLLHSPLPKKKKKKIQI
jgi:hypothetical protein